jgi:hypothetical protein
MTAILLNHGEIAAQDPGKCLAVFQRREIAFKTRAGMCKNKFFPDQEPSFARLAACQIPIIRSFFAIAKFF